MAKRTDIPLHLNPTFWKALASLASTDETRATLTCVHVRSARILEVTDGHCALQVTLDEDLPLAPGLYDPKAAVARVKAGIDPAPHPRDKFDAAGFPNFDPILRVPTVGYAERCDVGLNPRLVSRVNDAISDVVQAVTGAKDCGVMWDVGEDLEAVIITGKAPGVRVHAAVMPMRVEGPRTRPKKDTFDADALKAAQKRAAYLESVVAELRDEVIRLTNELNEAREAADTDAADAVRARETVEELRAEVNGLRYLRPRGDTVPPVLLPSPIVRA